MTEKADISNNYPADPDDLALLSAYPRLAAMSDEMKRHLLKMLGGLADMEAESLMNELKVKKLES